MTQIDLPSRENIVLAIDSGMPEDYHLVRLYYSWYAGWFYQHRLRMIADLLQNVHAQNLLEIGTGSGIFLKELLKHAEHITGIDIHKSYKGVNEMLSREKIDLNRVELRQGSILDIPYPDATFDVAVCVSVLEHFENPSEPLEEVSRVLMPGGLLVAGFPARTRLTAMLFGMLGYRDTDIHPASHTMILAEMRRFYKMEVARYYPLTQLMMYVACKASKPL